MALLYPDLQRHISNMKCLRVCQCCIIPFASQCHGGLPERTGDECISFGAILSTGPSGRLDVSKPQICALIDLGSITLPVRSKETVVLFDSLHHINRVFFRRFLRSFRRWSQPFSQQMLQWTYPEVTEQLLSSWLHRSGVDGPMGWLIMGVVWESGSHLLASSSII